MRCRKAHHFGLNSEDRYDVWNVKKEERPHLLLFNVDESSLDDEDDDNAVALLDGCDIPGWRKHKLISVSSYNQGVLNVGSGCYLFRKSAQIPTSISSTLKAKSKWKEVQSRLFVPPSKTASRLNEEETNGLKPHPWFEKDNVPVILHPIISAKWKAMKTCTWESLVKQFGDYSWRFSDTHGACMTLETYTKYTKSIEGQTDDAPLAVYDSQFHLDDRITLIDDYQVPPCFSGFDLFQNVLEDYTNDDGDERDSNVLAPPPYRWILMGPARSGTGLHIDPMGSHAWVTVVEGYKRWVLFPPSSDHESIGMQEPQIPSSIWFSEWYNQVMPKHPKAIEILQSPGETVYVPAGWPHLVLNLTDTVAITQNYATEYPDITLLTNAVKKSEPELYRVWLPKLMLHRQDLAPLIRFQLEEDFLVDDEKKEG